MKVIILHVEESPENVSCYGEMADVLVTLADQLYGSTAQCGERNTLRRLEMRTLYHAIHKVADNFRDVEAALQAKAKGRG